MSAMLLILIATIRLLQVAAPAKVFLTDVNVSLGSYGLL